MTTDDERKTGLSRRELIRRGAIAGGVAWTAPLILQSAAGAQVAGCSPAPCATYYFAKFEVSPDTAANWAAAGCTATPLSSSNGIDGSCPSVTPPVPGKTWLSVPVGALCFSAPGGTLTVSINPAGSLKNCQFLQVMSKKGAAPAGCKVEYASSTPACATSQRLFWADPSHVTVWLCCPS